MAETAVGLFEHSGTADAVVDALHVNGLPSNGIRVVSKPAGAAVNSTTSTPSIDFAAGLARDLNALGANKYEIDAYVAGVQRGNVLVFVTGSRAQAENAMTIMNAYDPVEIEEFAGAVPAATGTLQGEAPAISPVSSKITSSREKSEGARVFSW